MNTIPKITGEFSIDSFWVMLGIVILTIIVALAFLAILKMEQVKRLKTAVDKLRHSFNSLDEQAKLIVKTDLELNKTQEELEKRLNSLNALDRISRLISTTLDAEEIFRRLSKAIVSELGFEKILVLMFDKEKEAHARIEVGFSKETVSEILSRLVKDHSLSTLLLEGRTISSLNAPKQKREKITQLLGLGHFVLSPILTQDGLIGIFFVGNQAENMPVTEGDEDLISILSNQIGQALENANLFEQVYRSRQELESKIQDRTRELALALEKVQEISKAKSDFVSAVSHELRTPLTSIKGYASILITGKVGDIPTAVKERLEKINKHSDNLVKLINDLLDISRIESGRVEMKLEEHNIVTLIESIRDLLAPQMKDKNIQFETRVDQKIPSLLVDSTQIERVFINLLSNAVKFTPQNGTIKVNAQMDKDNALFQIIDTGIGISENELPKLFSEFYRVDNEVNQVVKGTGLGLVLVKKILEAHGGRIWVTSKAGTGTTFHFTLPLKSQKA
ncbi:MAG TPA: ATP-binding protein [Candidatus Omnitrophota bacterium]|nr:ATP-binding protein [Candidatus Omnitrophota bacterium]HPD84512.1 ATP-binding protein [Candidatus Omnitrophota bacterium]HRZ03370.1 ATP-binding protein [Candidatus Omnitrophota bacterium]